MTLTLYNTLTRKKEPFRPIDPSNVRMYVCGPTVYDFAHIGNARPVIVFDLLFRLLRHIYGPEHVTYARNITDVDDKINARAAEQYPDLPPAEAIAKLTVDTTRQFHEDIRALGVLMPDDVNRPGERPLFIEPRATEHIEDMKRLSEALVANGHAYVAQDHVLFNVSSMPDYGRLANRSLEEMEAGARVDVAPYKKGPMDFVLWKPSKPGEPAWPSPCGIAAPGRPGWHLECSAMSDRWLWEEAQGALTAAGLAQPHVFDIHGGGIDLVFPHHENEVAQSRCGFGTAVMANYWMHNGFLQVEGEKMSKSLGNFVTIRELLDGWRGRRWTGQIIRLTLLMTQYRQPLDFTERALLEATGILGRWTETLDGPPLAFIDQNKTDYISSQPDPEVLGALLDDLNTPRAIAAMHKLAKSRDANDHRALFTSGALLGLWSFEELANRREIADNTLTDVDSIELLVEARSAARKAKDFKEADRIRDELAAMAIQLKDAKDPATGEIVTTWEVKR